MGFWETVTPADLGLLYAKEHGRNRAVMVELLQGWADAGYPPIRTCGDLAAGWERGLPAIKVGCR